MWRVHGQGEVHRIGVDKQHADAAVAPDYKMAAAIGDGPSTCTARTTDMELLVWGSHALQCSATHGKGNIRSRGRPVIHAHDSADTADGKSTKTRASKDRAPAELGPWAPSSKHA